MQPLEVTGAFDTELSSLGFTPSVEGRIEAELLRRLSADEVIAEFFKGGIEAVELEDAELMVQTKGLVSRSLWLVLTTVGTELQLAQTQIMKTSWTLMVLLPARPVTFGTGQLRRQAILKRLRLAIRGDDNAALSDDDGALTEALVEWMSVNNPTRLISGALLTQMPFTLTSNLDAMSQEFD